MKRKILIDVTTTIPKLNSYISGIGKSTYWLIKAMDKIDKEKIPFNIELCAYGLKSVKFDFYNWNFKHHRILIPQECHINGKKIDCIYRNLFLNYDLYHIPQIIDDVSKKENFVSTFHDLDAYSLSDNIKYKELYYNIAHQSKRIVCCSEYSKKEVVERLDIAPEKIDVIYWGCDRELFRKKDSQEIVEVLRKFRIDRPYFFSCSCNNPRKNIETALAAFRKFLTYKPEHIFVLAWGNPKKDLLDMYAPEIEKGQIMFLPFTTDEELVTLYNGASMSIYVTRKEGFGFPILESFACETPIMTCRNSCLEEVGKNAAIYVGEDNIDEMVDVMLAFERNVYDRKKFLKESSDVLSCFSWEKCAYEYIDFYQKTLDA